MSSALLSQAIKNININNNNTNNVHSQLSCWKPAVYYFSSCVYVFSAYSVV